MSTTATAYSFSADEGVQFGAMMAGVFILIFVIEYFRLITGKKKELAEEKYANAATWSIFLILTAAGHVHKPNDPSILITAGEGMQLFAMFLIWIAPRRGQDSNAPRASVEFGMLTAFSLTLRLWCTMKFNGYLPVDRTGDGCIQFIEAASLFLTVYGLGRIEMSGLAAARSMTAILASIVLATVCYGNLDRNTLADRLYAASVYSELFSWLFMYKFIKGKGKDGVSSMAFLPSFVQSACKGYFWFAALDETLVKKPVLLQGIFNSVLVADYAFICVLLMVMSTMVIKVVPKIDLIPSLLCYKVLDV